MRAVPRHEQTLLGSPPKRRAVGQRGIEVGVPGVEVGVEMTRPPSISALVRPQQRVGDRMVAADRDQACAVGDQRARLLLDLGDRFAMS